jgi:hypothetical protein
MSEPTYLIKDKSLEKSQDFAFLRKAGLEYIQELAHQKWTDHNLHDPGITFLELFSYALTDLGFRTAFPVKDLLTVEEQGSQKITGHFHTALNILSNQPVSFDDYRKLLIDIEGVRMAWLKKHIGRQTDGTARSVVYALDRGEQKLIDYPASFAAGEEPLEPLNGLFDVLLEFEESVEEESRVIKAGLPADTALSGAISPSSRGLVFDVHHPLTIKEVSIIPATTDPVQLRVLASDGSLLYSLDVTVPAANVATPVLLDLSLQPGNDYEIIAQGAGSLERVLNAPFPMELEDILSIKAGNDAASVYYFFFDWKISYAVNLDEGPRAAETTREDVLLTVKDRLHSNRSLCQDHMQVKELEREEIAICADIELSPDADVHEVMAEILYQVDRHISPPVNFYTLQELRDKGRSIEEIFQGPILDHGFIDQEEFDELSQVCFFRSSDLINIIMDIPGVVAVKEFSLLSFIDLDTDPVLLPGDQVIVRDGVKYKVKEEPWILEIEDTNKYAPVFAEEKSKVIFYKNQLPYYPRLEQVLPILLEKKGVELRSKLSGHDRDLPIPVGTDRYPETYLPAQNDLPPTYRVGKIRVPSAEGEARKAQSRQLKAYLLWFEQILANYLSQLAHFEALFSWEAGPIQTYFTQPLTDIAELEDLYPNYNQLSHRLNALIESPETARERKNRFLDHLLARFGEDVSTYHRLMESLFGEAAALRLIEDKRLLLQDYPAASMGRGHAFDYRKALEAENLSGYQHRIYRLLGIRPVEQKTFTHEFLKVVEVSGQWKVVLVDEDGIEVLQSIARPDDDDPIGFCRTRDEACVLIDMILAAVADFTPSADASEEDLLPWDNQNRLLERCGPDGKTAPIAEIVSGQESQKAWISVFLRELADGEGFHLVEHILLRKRTMEDAFLPITLPPPDDCKCPEVTDPYSFRMSVLLPSWPRRFRDLRFRQFVEDSIRRETPAHIFPKICWISYCQLRQLETVLLPWLQELAGLDERLRGEIDWKATTVLPATDDPLKEAYRDALNALIERLFSLDNVYPLARLHDCGKAAGDSPQITLNQTNLGTF